MRADTFAGLRGTQGDMGRDGAGATFGDFVWMKFYLIKEQNTKVVSSKSVQKGSEIIRCRICRLKYRCPYVNNINFGAVAIIAILTFA